MEVKYGWKRRLKLKWGSQMRFPSTCSSNMDIIKAKICLLFVLTTKILINLIQKFFFSSIYTLQREEKAKWHTWKESRKLWNYATYSSTSTSELVYMMIYLSNCI